MLFNDTFKTIFGPSEADLREKGSRFLAFAFPVKSLDDIKPILQELKLAHPKANHHCWAAKVTTAPDMFKLNDDGEPSGTAGRPILNAIRSAELTNIFIVVVRYFGGTLLGVPGLISAYRSAAAMAISAAKITELTVNDVFEHEHMNAVMRIVKEHELVIISQDYTDRNVLVVCIRKTLVNNVVDKLDKLLHVDVRYLYTE